MMRNKINILFVLVLILSTKAAFGNDSNKTKAKPYHNKLYHNAKVNTKSNSDRIKRSLDDEDNPFWPNRGKKELKGLTDLDKEPPFWATRGRRDSSSVENSVEWGKSSKQDNSDIPDVIYGNVKHTRDDVMAPFWGNRGRRSSEELDNDKMTDDPFWGNRGRRQSELPLDIASCEGEFSGNRGTRQDNSPFWGNRGRREDEPFWGNRGRREDEPFWGNRGRREDEPFWGNRGRRDSADPFWGNRGRRDDFEPFWGNRGRRKESEQRSRGRQKQDLKESILSAINIVENDIENLSRLRRSNGQTSFWSSRSRDSKLSHLFSGEARTRVHQPPGFLKPLSYSYSTKSSDPGTVLDNRIYAEEPHYIIVERNSRSSAEDDPYYISRGKKYYINLSGDKAARDRRGAIEEIVKSVRNDPYYIARGKKDAGDMKVGNLTMVREEFAKAKDLICATINLIMIKNEKNVMKRDVDSERERRTILKKLAAQLQMDPYFVSRGKKSDNSRSNEELEDFINDLASKCT